MWIKIKKTRIDLSKISDYGIYEDSIRFYYPVFTGEYNDEQHYEAILVENKVEAKAIIKQIDELLEVKEL